MEMVLNSVVRWGMVAVSVFASALFFSAGIAVAADQERTQQQVESQSQEQIYGSQLMTDQERTEYRAKMHAAKTTEEQERIRKEHHENMKMRAEERGMKLPDEPPMQGGGMGPGHGPGGGQRP
jgi:hypothetical protein